MKHTTDVQDHLNKNTDEAMREDIKTRLRIGYDQMLAEIDEHLVDAKGQLRTELEDLRHRAESALEALNEMENAINKENQNG